MENEKVDSKKNSKNSNFKNFEGFDISDLEENFSALASELKSNYGVSLNNLPISNSEQNETDIKIPYYRGYNPTIKDFLERASTHEECLEIIEYCLNKGEINQEEATELRRRLEKGGPNAFGTRNPGHYDQKLH